MSDLMSRTHGPDVRQLAAILAAIADVDPSPTAAAGRDTPETVDAYRRRNALILSALALAPAAGITAGLGYDPTDPRPIVAYLQLPTGQVSWHLPAHAEPFDGHDTTTKYARVAAFADAVGQEPGHGTYSTR